LAGDRNAVNTVSPTPSLLSMPGPSAGFQITGTIVRVMMFHSLLIEMGITGWMLRMFCVPFSGPKFRLVLFWNGRLIRLPTGFWASFASSSAVISAKAGLAAIRTAAAIATDRSRFFMGGFALNRLARIRAAILNSDRCRFTSPFLEKARDHPSDSIALYSNARIRRRRMLCAPPVPVFSES